MSHNTCPLPDRSKGPEDAVQRMLGARRIAVVGLSDDPSRPSHGVASYLRSAGKEIIPVNPNCTTVMGLKSYASLEEVPGEIDVVDVFRRPEYCSEIVRSAIALGVKGVWLQSGITNPESRQLAANAGIDYVENRCMMVEEMRFRAESSR
ncbi:MAG: CoA-binding protein [Phycisphaerales bacterium]|jgi:predicted CoA-binding protein|nr:CoA-binding protein [Phycisphaerales bacterium]MDB5300167.1 CoA-binding protein [Phycisphaerales bacterium]MDB5302943.1 CoA-binding protein [Phycisphaerales bacterium]